MMKSLLVHFDDDDGASGRLALALELARAAGGSVHCAYAIRAPRLPVPSMSRSLTPAEVDAILAEPGERLQSAHARFDAATWGSGVPVTWEAGRGPAHALLASHAPYADLLIAGRASAEGGLYAADVFGLICHTLRPVLVVPPAPAAPPPFARVLVAWNGKRESARAAHEALPWLRRAESVEILVVEETLAQARDRSEEMVARLREALAAHGVAAGSVHRSVDDPGQVGAAVLSAARQQRADLLVMGAFGHSRAFEYWLGGATRDVLERAELPVLLAH